MDAAVRADDDRHPIVSAALEDRIVSDPEELPFQMADILPATREVRVLVGDGEACVVDADVDVVHLYLHWVSSGSMMPMPSGHVNSFVKERFGLDQWVSGRVHETLGKESRFD